MADNIQVTQGTGTTMATKDASGVHHAKSLFEFDVSGTPTLVSSSNPLPVSDAGGSLTIDGSVTATGITGNVAAGATDSGNPVKIAGVYNTSAPSLSNGQRGDLQLDARGNAKLTLFDVVEITVTPTVSTSPAYAINDCIGGKLTFANAALVSAGWCRVTGIQVIDLDKDMPACILTLFTADPSTTTFTDNAALDVADADMDKIRKTQAIVDWTGYADNAICSVDVDVMCKLASGTSLYGCLHALQALQPAGTSDWKVKLTIERYL